MISKNVDKLIATFAPSTPMSDTNIKRRIKKNRLHHQFNTIPNYNLILNYSFKPCIKKTEGCSLFPLPPVSIFHPSLRIALFLKKNYRKHTYTIKSGTNWCQKTTVK